MSDPVVKPGPDSPERGGATEETPRLEAIIVIKVAQSDVPAVRRSLHTLVPDCTDVVFFENRANPHNFGVELYDLLASHLSLILNRTREARRVRQELHTWAKS